MDYFEERRLKYMTSSIFGKYSPRQTISGSWGEQSKSPLANLESAVESFEKMQPKPCLFMSPKMYDDWMSLFNCGIPFYKIEGRFVLVI